MRVRNRGTGRRKKLLCYGDSNTHGTKAMRAVGDTSRYRADARWTGQLARLLEGSARVIEAGQRGRTTVHDDPVEGPHKNGLRVLPAVLETHRPIDVVLMMLGTNDLKARFSVTPIDVARSMERLVHAVERYGLDRSGRVPSTVIIAPVPIDETGFLGEMFVGGAEKSRALASYLSETAERLGCGFFDAGAHGAVDPVDGVHLSRQTHGDLAAALARYLRDYVL